MKEKKKRYGELHFIIFGSPTGKKKKAVIFGKLKAQILSLLFLTAMESFIIDHILTKQKFDIIDCIQIQDSESKTVFDVAFKEIVGKLASMKKQAAITEWANTHILNHFEVRTDLF